MAESRSAPAGTELSRRAERSAVDAALRALCERELGDIEQVNASVADAIRYSLLGGGKRLRGVLLLSAYSAAGGRDDASALAAAVEVVHAYSLVHDDLPCMDDDDVRRGRATLHRVFGVRAATVAGLAMVPLAARAASRAASALGLAASATGRVVSELMRASGAGGMIGGQLLDLEGEGRPLQLFDMERVHRAKTGALIMAAVVIGGLAAQASDAVLQALARYGDSVGLAFQIADDVLDVTATSDVLGKTAGRDLALGKSTFPSLLGVEGARQRGESLVEEGCAALSDVGVLTPALAGLARFAVRRPS